MAIIEPEAPVKGRLRWYLLGGAVAGVALILFLALRTGPASSNRPGKDALTDNPLESARQALLRETDLETCRAALTQLNTYLSKNEKSRPPSLTETERAALQKRFDLDDAEVGEVDADNFTQLDGHYLDLCFLLRDAAVALDVESPGAAEGQRRPAPLRQAEAAFDWAVRQVRLEKSNAPPLPPHFALRRGWGTSLERALVFLELLRHVGTADERLTGCLVYCPDKSGAVRLWACGVVVNDKSDLYLFDPRLGLALPGPKGKGIATLAVARTDATVLGQLTVSDAHPYDVTPEQAAKAELRYVCSLSALAPRMRSLQDNLLPPTVKVRLAVAAADEMKRLDVSAQAQIGPDARVKTWQDGKASGAGVLRRFLPPEEGGSDVSKPFSRRDQFAQDIVPWSAMPEFFRNENRFPPQVGLGLRVRVFFAQPFLQMAQEPHHARDELLRGHYNKALPELDSIRTGCRGANNQLSLEKKNDNLGEEVGKWLNRAFEVYAEQQRAANPQQREEANHQIEAMWNEGRAVGVLLAGTRSWPLRLEALFQLSLCKHEQAEKLQHRSELSPDDAALAERAADAWREAVNLWQQYLDEYRGAKSASATAKSSDAAKFEAQAANAAAARTGNASGAVVRMLGRAQLLSGDRDGALRTWHLEYPTVELEKVGTLYLAKKVQ